MYGPFSENLEEAARLFLDFEEPDTPRNCHRHCVCWDTEGECCECGESRTPIHSYLFESEFLIPNKLAFREEEPLYQDEALTYVDEIPVDDYLGG